MRAYGICNVGIERICHRRRGQGMILALCEATRAACVFTLR